jgi:GT2 family glycosyltransferase
MPVSYPALQLGFNLITALGNRKYMSMVEYYPAVNRVGAPVCSVCVANYNGVSILADCLDSILAQQGGFNIQIIVHDDASTDESLIILREQYPQVEVLASRENVGFCIGNNRMAACASGEYILLLNNDAVLHPDAISTFIQEAARQKEQGILTLPQYDWETGALVDRGCLLDPFFNPIPNLDPAVMDVAYVIGACLWCPRDLWFELGGFPEWMESIAEDLYICGIARIRGHSVRAIQNSGYRHHQGATFGGNRVSTGSLRTSIKRRRLSERNKTCALAILTPGFAVWPLLIAHMLALTLEGVVLCAVRRDVTLWLEIYGHAIATPFRDFSILRAERHAQQSRRLVPTRQWFLPIRWRLRKLTMARRYGVPKFY